MHSMDYLDCGGFTQESSTAEINFTSLLCLYIQPFLIIFFIRCLLTSFSNLQY